MTYSERLKPWAVVRLLSSQHWAVVTRHQKRSDAEGFLRIYQRLFPQGRFEIVFDLTE